MTLNEILTEAERANIPIAQFVEQYFSNDQDLLGKLNAESRFSKQERLWREAVANTTTPITIADAAAFQEANKLTDADMQRVFNVSPKSLNDYRTNQQLLRYAGPDEKLSLEELINFAKDTNRELQDVATLANPTNPQQLLQQLTEYAGEQERIARLPVSINDADGKPYDVTQLRKLYDQVAQNFDTSNVSGSAFGTDVRDALANNPGSVNIGFNATEAAKLFGKTPTAAQMVVLDIARGLLNSGVTDVSQVK